jgi:hypothetical protein
MMHFLGTTVFLVAAVAYLWAVWDYSKHRDWR